MPNGWRKELDISINMKHTIKVSRKYIKLGKRGFCHKCPIALATSDQINKRAIVYSSDAPSKTKYSKEPARIMIDNTYLNPNLPSTVVNLPRRVDRWIKRFDRKGKKAVKSIKFTIDI